MLVRLADKLTAPLGRLHYSAYDRAKASKWRTDMAAFEGRVAEVRTEYA